MLAFAALSASAQTPDSRISLRDLTGEAIGGNPEILSARNTYAAWWRARESGPPDPMASMEANAEFQRYRAVHLGVISRLKQAYYRLQHSYAAQDLLRRHRELFEAILQMAVDRYSAGVTAQSDVFKAQARIGILEARLVKLEQERRASEAEIDAILNRAAGTPVGRPEDLKPKESVATLEELFASATRPGGDAVNQPLRARIQDAYLAAQASAKLMKIYAQAVAPNASLALESSVLAYGAGRADFFSVISDYVMSFDYAMGYLDESLNYLLALARLEEITGRPLTDGI